MAIIKKFTSFQNLSNYQTFLVDSNPLSDYFRITEFKDTFTGGKNGFLIEGSPYLRETTEVKIEILDVEGNPIYFEPGNGVPEYYEGLSKLVSVHVYPDTPIGIGKITILGELKQYVDNQGVVRPIPTDWKGVYNVKWEKEFKINKNLANEDIVRFYKRPQIGITELIKPIFSKTIPSVTDVVEVTGVPQQPVLDTNLSNWTAGTIYKLIRATGSWDRDVDENQITISSLNYSPTIIEVLNDREVLVDVPYTENNLVKSFVSQSASVTYSDFQNEIIGESALTGSFAKIDMYQLKTFVGDVARVKIFRKSRNTAGDFQFVQESKLESTELLRDVTTQNDNEISYGNFTETNLSNYWVTSSNDHPTSVNSSILSQALKVDYDSGFGGVQKLITSESFSLSKDVEYTLSFKTLLSGSSESEKYIKAYFSGSYTNSLGNPTSYTQSFMHISGSSVYNTRQNVSQNILAERDIDAKLVLEFKGDDWYVSSVSLRNAQETSFSPDEFTLIQDIPRKLATETFDFRFEFYDINNNYIPVDVTAVGTFDGGNDFPTSGKILTFESDRNAFRFSTGSIANPYNQTIQFKTTAQNLTGSILFTSQAFDVDGNYLLPSNYSQYPGLLTNVTTAGALLTLNNFTGSFSGGGDAPYVGSIVYTASLENLQEFETVYRLEDGDNAPSLIVTSNTNQFIYEPTALEPKPSGQSITVRAQRKNLASLITPIEVNSGSNLPELTYVNTSNGVDTYTISALEFSSSFASNNFDEVTYSFTGSDVFGNEQYDEITISKVINFDGVSVVLSTENTSFESDSTGTVTGTEFDKGDGTVDVRVGSKVITHDDAGGGTAKNTFDIVSVTPSSGLTANSTAPTTNSYGISAMSVDSGTLSLLIRYKAGDNSTTIDFNKIVNYSKTKKAAPVLSIETTNKDQSVTAKSTGEQIDSFSNSVVSVKETYNGSTTTKTITSLTATQAALGSIATTPSTGTIGLAGKTMANGTNSLGVAVSATVTDSEGTSRTLTDSISLSKVKKSSPIIIASVNPQSQTVESNTAFTSVGTPQDVTLIVNEGGTNYTYTTGTVGSNQFKITSVTGGTNNNDGTITPTTPTDETGTSGIITYSYTNSEGTAFTSKTINFNVGVAIQGEPGVGAFSIEVNPPSQEVIIDIQDDIESPDTFVVQVFDSEGSYTYSATLASNATFKITNLAQTNTGGTPTNTSATVTPATPTNANGSDVTFDITVKDRAGTTSDVISKTHKIRVVADGSTGPGIVFTGPWDTDRIYQYDLSNGRRDAVLYDGTYYATLQQAGTSVGTPDAEPTYWESLGTDDFFVAAKIAIFEESYVQNTLNIGTTSNTISAANITLWGGDTYPYFSLGQSASVGTQEFGANGIFIGRHTTAKNSDAPNGAYVLSLVNGTTSYMKWNGSTLDIKGNLTISGESSPLDPTQITNTSDPMGGGTLNYNPNFTIVASDGRPDGVKAVYGSATTTNISYQDTEKSILKLYHASDTSIGAGFPAIKVNKDAKYIIHFRVKTTSSNVLDGFYFRMQEYDAELPIGITHICHNATSGESGVVEDTRQITQGTQLVVNTPVSGDIDNGPITIDWTDYIVTYTPTSTAKWVSPIFLNWTGMGTRELHVDRLAVMLDTSDKDQGTVGGWNITSSEIQGGSPSGGGNGSFTTQGIRLGASGYISAKQFYVDTSGNANFKGAITGGTLDIGGADATSFHVDSGGNIWSGAATYASGPFKVSNTGVLSATGATISGAITATSGTFTGTINASGGTFSGYVTGGTMRFGKNVQTGKDGIYIGADDYWYDDGTFSLGGGDITYDGATLNVNGVLQVGDNISDLTNDADYQNPTEVNEAEKTAGKVGSWKISSTAIYSSTSPDTSGYTTSGITLYSGGSIHAPNFYINTSGGAFFRGTLSAPDGNIGGWTINSTNLSNNGVSLSTNDSGQKGLFIDNAQGTEAVAVHDGTSFRNTTSTAAFTAWSDPANSQVVNTATFGQNTPSTAGYTFYSADTANMNVPSGKTGMIGITTSEIDVLIGQNPGTYWLDRGSTTFVQTYHFLYLEVRNSSNVVISDKLIASGYVNYDGSYSKQISNLGTASILLGTGTYKARIKHLIGINYLAQGDSITLHDAYYSGVNAVYATQDAGRSVELSQIGLKTTYGINNFTVNTTTGGIDLLEVGGSSTFTGPATFTGIDASVIDVDSLSVGEISLRSGVLTVNGAIRATGDIYALSTSDGRLKTNLNPITNPIDIIKKLNGYTFNWNSESNKPQDVEEIGVIAQEVKEVLPQVVGDKGNGYLGVSYEKMVAVLIEGIKTQQIEIENLREEIEQLKKYIK